MDTNKKIEKAVLEQAALSLHREITPEETDQIILWHRGKSLRELTMSHGWSVLLDMTEDYINDADSDYLKTVGKDPSKVTAEELKEKHAVAFAVRRAFSIFLQDIQNAVDMSNTPPDVVRQAAKQLKLISDSEMKASN